MSKYNTMSDHELVELYEQGIDEAFDLLLARNQEHVFAYIMRLTQNAERANDIFQETFMKIPEAPFAMQKLNLALK